MKKLFPIILAAIVFVAALTLMRPAPSRTVVVAAYDLRAGHALSESDLALKPVPEEVLSDDTLEDISLAVGQTLRIDRGQGDTIRASQLGSLIQLEPDERAVAVQITDPTGVAGLLTPGQKVGLVASIPQNDFAASGTFSKAAIENLRVLYIDPQYAANLDANVPVGTPESGFGATAGINTDDRAKDGTVILAVPVDMQTIFYDFSATGAVSETRQVNVLELLSALGATDGTQITLYLMPSEESSDFSSPGLWLPDLIRTPLPTATPTPIFTPTPTPFGWTPPAPTATP